ncbi:MAG: hypothetical protein V4611_04035 [Patescibacteria group bacterium]
MVQQDETNGKQIIEVELARSGNIYTLNFYVFGVEDSDLIGLLPLIEKTLDSHNLTKYRMGNPISVMLSEEKRASEPIHVVIDEITRNIAEGLRLDFEEEVKVERSARLKDYILGMARYELAVAQAQAQRRTKPRHLYPLL